ncbi:MAG: 50S ribosomal protein L30 [Candidatus Schekmanbacteria bacterium RBG_16_38_11]|uniref:50S ribosomal protein L30 n=2 Tax=Candidatus Schekmaniibacteriota TaxID=1817811 RepID=A0A1F7RTG7_9BACT|nr:MAG: 50S ribosomal protein L30 [Candidatus Schekmanbacteria bacterium RBG_16_38_11]
MNKRKGKNLKITLVRSFIGSTKGQRATAIGLGLKKINQSVIRKDIPEVRGMIAKIPHLLKVEEV